MGKVAIGCLLVAVALALAGCGDDDSSDPGDAVEAASTHRDAAYGEYLLSEVELDQAILEEARADDDKNPSRPDREDLRDSREALRDAHRIEDKCREGDGLEPCTEIEPIEQAAEEMAQSNKSD